MDSTPEHTDASKTLELQVSSALKATPTKDGKLDFSTSELSEEMKLAVMAEKRRRDTQADFTKARQALATSEAEIEALRTLIPNAISQLPQEEQDRLEDLKYSNPDEWRVAVNQAEREAKEKATKLTEEKIAEAHSRASKEFSEAEKHKALATYNANSGSSLTEEQLAFDVPPRLFKKLDSGEITYLELLAEADKLINGKVVHTQTPATQPNINSAPNGVGVKTKDSLEESYNKTIF